MSNQRGPPSDTSLPKKGSHSVGVARQYCGALGKIANCQSIVTWHWTDKHLHWPLAAQLYLPAEWTEDPERMAGAGIPLPAQRFREKWRIALDLLDAMKPQLPAYEAIVFDAGYGVVLPLLSELEKRGEPYVAQVPSNARVADPRRSHPGPKVGRPRNTRSWASPPFGPRSMIQWRDRLPKGCWRQVTDSIAPRRHTTVRAVAVRVRASQRASRWRQPGVLRWLLIEELADSTFKSHLSNLPEDTPLEEFVRLAHQRWAIEQGYHQLKEELGLEHFEGRSWRGLHHHLTLCFLAFCFLACLRSSKKLPAA